MSFYNLMCQLNIMAGRLLQAINLDQDSIPRFRDVWVNDDMTEVTVHTRTGGGNRDCYKTENDTLTKHPLYLRDEDEEFDCTYADFVFRLPEEEKAKLLAEIAELAKDMPSDRKDQIMRSITKESCDKFSETMSTLYSLIRSES